MSLAREIGGSDFKYILTHPHIKNRNWTQLVTGVPHDLHMPISSPWMSFLRRQDLEAQWCYTPTRQLPGVRQPFIEPFVHQYLQRRPLTIRDSWWNYPRLPGLGLGSRGSHCTGVRSLKGLCSEQKLEAVIKTAVRSISCVYPAQGVITHSYQRLAARNSRTKVI